MTNKISVCFNHYRGEGGTAEEISKDYEVEVTSEDVPSEDRRSTYHYITIVGTEENVMGFLEDYALTHIVCEENIIDSDDEDVIAYYDSEDDSPMM